MASGFNTNVWPIDGDKAQIQSNTRSQFLKLLPISLFAILYAIVISEATRVGHPMNRLPPPHQPPFFLAFRRAIIPSKPLGSAARHAGSLPDSRGLPLQEKRHGERMHPCRPLMSLLPHFVPCPRLIKRLLRDDKSWRRSS